MSDTIEKHISGVAYWFWSHTGTVTGVIPKSETQVWSSGGGGYVDPKYGGVVHAPTVHSHTSHWKEIRIDGDNGRPYTVTVHDGIVAFPGDRASVIYAKPKKHELGYVHGFKNHREDRWWSFNCNTFVKPEYRPTLDGMVFRFWSKGLLSFLAAMAMVTLVMTVLPAPFWFLLQPWNLIPWVPAIFILQWPMILCVTIGIAILVNWSYKIMRSIASKQASKAILAVARDIVDRPVVAVAQAEQPKLDTKAA